MIFMNKFRASHISIQLAFPNGNACDKFGRKVK